MILADLQTSVIDWLHLIVTGLALVAGGIWTIHIHRIRRAHRPKAQLTHRVNTIRLGDKRILISVGIEIENTGDVLLELSEGKVMVQRVWPCIEPASLEWIEKQLHERKELATEADWQIIETGKRIVAAHDNRLEPGEIDTIYCDFIAPHDLQVAGAAKGVRIIYVSIHPDTLSSYVIE